ncbi:MAG: helix-turn-helix domain-containing protein [Panacagrimonas sp.]
MLVGESVSASDIVDAERRKLAIEHLSQSEMRLSQIVGLLGYGNQSALNRSCQRWFGKSPGAVRESIQRGERI